jgi:hypothetical protein
MKHEDITNIDIDATTDADTPINPCALAAHSIAACFGFRAKAADAKAAARAAVKTAIEIFGRSEAAKAVRDLLIRKHGFDKRRVSEALLEFGLRTRAASEKSNKVELAPEKLASLVALATELFGDHAKIALRRAYLAAKGAEE